MLNHIIYQSGPSINYNHIYLMNINECRELFPFFIFSCFYSIISELIDTLYNKGGFAHMFPLNSGAPIAGPVGSIIYADLYGSIKIKFPVLIPMRIYEDLC